MESEVFKKQMVLGPTHHSAFLLILSHRIHSQTTEISTHSVLYNAMHSRVNEIVLRQMELWPLLDQDSLGF